MSYTDPCYDNLDSLSNRKIVFLCDRIASIKGAVVEQQIPLKEFFAPITDSFFSVFDLPNSGNSVQLSFANLDDPTFLFLYLTYDSSLVDEDMYISWSYDETNWMPLGKMFCLSGTTSAPLGYVYLKNESDKDVTVNAIIGK